MIYDEPAHLIIAKLRDAGVRISLDQLADWHRAGLILEPERHFPGGGGSQSIYPHGTFKQAMACAELMSKHNSVQRVGWVLWLNGYPVSEKLWRGVFSDAHQLFVDFFNYSLLDGEFSEAVERTIEDTSASVRQKDFLGQIKRRVGRLAYHQLLMTLAGVAVGTFERNVENKADDGVETTLFGRMLGLTPAPKRKKMPSSPFLPDTGEDAADRLSQISAVMPLLARPDFLDNWTEDDFRVLRDDMVVSFSVYLFIRNREEHITGAQHFGVKVLKSLLKASPKRQALLGLMWKASLDEIPEWRSSLELIKQQVRENDTKQSVE